MSIRIQSYNRKQEVKPHSFYALSKGLNSGKPLPSPCANCFVVSVENEDERNRLYWLCFSLWQANAFHPLLAGSVIPFIRIKDFKTTLLKHLPVDHHKQNKAIKALQSLEEQERLYKHNLQLIQEAKQAFLYRYLKTR